LTGEITMTSEPAPNKTIEMWLGSHLNKIGVIFLVCGVALLIANQFQSFTPLMKILTGLFSGVALVATGLWFEKRTDTRLYGYVLSAGGWALSYFTAFAAYHIETVRIIQSPVIDLLLLMGISWGAVLHFLRLRSELITTISLSLAFMTTCFSSVSLFTLISCAVLVLSLVYIVSKMRWHGLYLAGVVTSYSIYLFFLLPNVISDPWIQSLGFTAGQSRFWLTIGFSSLFWAAFTAALFSLDESSANKKTFLITASLVNCVAYTASVLWAMDSVYPEKRFAFVLSLGLAYMMSASRGMKSVLPSISTLHTVFALFLISLAVPLHFTNHWSTSIWLMEVPLLAWIGIRNQLPVYSRFAAVLAAFSFFPLVGYDIWQNHPLAGSPIGIAQGKLDGLIGASAYLAAFVCHRWMRRANSRSSRAYYFLASVVATYTVFGYFNYELWPLTFIVGGGIAACMGFKIRDLFVRRIGEIGIYLGLFQLICSHGNYFFDLTAAITLLVIDHCYKPYQSAKISTARMILTVGSLFCLGVVSQTTFGTYSLSAVWAVLATALLACGFYLKDRIYRRAALVLAAIAGILFYLSAPWATLPTIIGLPWREVTAILLCAASAIAARLYYKPENRLTVGSNWSPAYAASVGFGYLVLQRLLSVELPYQYLPLAYCAAASIPIVVGIITSYPALRALGWMTALIFPLFSLGFEIHNWSFPATMVLTLILYGQGFLFRCMKSEARVPMEKDLEHAFSFIATFLMTLVIGENAEKCLTLLWAAQGLGLLVVGFSAKDKLFRIYGLTLLTLVCGKLVLVDMATLQMTYRILSFIAVGLVLLITSFFYVRFPGRTEGSASSVAAADVT